MKIGVSILPCVVVREPKRAAEPGSFFMSSNVIADKNIPLLPKLELQFVKLKVCAS
jgi:hypothetical protein